MSAWIFIFPALWLMGGIACIVWAKIDTDKRDKQRRALSDAAEGGQ